MNPTVVIVARAPVPGKAKTRLAAHVGDDAASRLAGEALLDTIDAAEATGWPVCVAMTGDLTRSPMREEIGAALDRHLRISQRGEGFAERLTAAHADCDDGAGVVQIGMDTPHVRADALLAAGRSLDRSDAVLGMAHDGGWWLLGVRVGRHAECLKQVPMSTSRTGELTRQALRSGGIRVGDVPSMTDVDTWADAIEVATIAPDTRFGRAVDRLREGGLG